MADDILLKLSVDDRDLIRTRKEQQKFQFQIAQITKELRKGTITSFRYNTELVKQSKQLSKLGGSYRQAASEVQAYAKKLRTATDDELNLALAMTKSGKGMRRMEILAQQAGYQIGDFAVQVQSGTNVAVAFGQQASQLLGFFGPYGAIAGAGIAIGTGLIAPLLNAKKAAEETKKEVQTLNKALDSLDTISQRVALNVESNLKEAFRNSSEAVKGLLNSLNELEFKANIKPVRKAMDDVALSVDKVDIAIKTMMGFNKLIKEGETLDAVQKGLLEDATAMVDENIVLAIEIDKVKAALDRIGQSKTSKELAENFALAKAELEKVGGPAAEQALSALEKIAQEAGIAEVIMNNLADAADRLGTNLKFAADISPEVQARAVRMGVESGAIPPEALADLPQTSGEKAYQDLLEARRKAARSEKDKKAPKQKLSELERLNKQLDLENRMAGQTKARQRIMQALGDTYDSTSEKTIEKLEKQINVINEVKRAEEDRLQIQQTVESAFEDGFMSMIDGTKSVTEAFKDMARQIIAELYRVMVVQRMVKAISGFLPFADGGVFSGGSQVQAFANGGVVGSPTYFPMTGGKTGLMGEAGPEAIMPLKRGKNGKLGVQVEGGTSGDTITVNQTINVSTGVQQTVRTEIKSLMPQIAEGAKAAVADAKRRGGSYGKAF